MDNLILRQEEVEKLYHEIKRDPDLVARLNEYEKSKVLEFAKFKRSTATTEREKLEKEVENVVDGIATQEQYSQWLGKVNVESDALAVLKVIKGHSEIHKPAQNKMNSAFSDFRQLVDLKVQSEAIEELNKILSSIQILPFIPNWRIAVDEYEFLNSEVDNGDQWYKFRRGYEKAFLRIQAIIERDLRELAQDEVKRVAYLKDIYRQLHVRPFKVSSFLSLEDSVAYFKSSEFRELKQNIDNCLWEGLNDIGYILSLCYMYRQAIDSFIEEEFIIEEISDNIPQKQRQKTIDNKIHQSTSEAENSLTINQIITKHRTDPDLYDLLDQSSSNILYAPFPIIWQGSVEKKKEIEKDLRQGLINKLNMAWDQSEEWVKEFRQESIQLPHDIDNIFKKYFGHYLNLVEQYRPFKRWALEYWAEPVKPDSKFLVNGLWGELFDLCCGNNLEFGVSLEIVEIVFAANLTVAKLSRERIGQSSHENAVADLIARANEQQPAEKYTNPSIASVELDYEFLNLFDCREDATSCLTLMHTFRLIKSSGEHNIGTREKARLMAFVEVLQQKHLLPTARTASSLTESLAKQVKLPYRRPRNSDRKKYDTWMQEYLSQINAISTGKVTWPIVADSGR